jgi:hypothetical protein
VANWWTLSAVATELIGAALIGRGLALENPQQWIEGRGSPRWGFSADADLSYASDSADAGVGFVALLVGITLQGLGAIDATATGSAWLLLAPTLGLIVTLLATREWSRRREVGVIRGRINNLVVDRRWTEDDWQAIIHTYSRALEQDRRGRRPGEDAWAHLDRIYGEGVWLPVEAADGMRNSYETNVSITHLDELGDLWLPWYVRRDDPATPIQDIDAERAVARQLRIHDIEDHEIRQALGWEYEHEGRKWTHLSRIEDYRRQWEGLPGLSPERVPAWHTADGPVLRDGCHRTCAVYLLNPPDWRVDLELSDPPPDDPDTQPGPRDAALGRE